jgi:hypothetical protein
VRPAALGPSPGNDGPSLTLTIPLDKLGPVQVNAPPPALVSRINAAHVGLSPDQLVDALREMARDPRFAAEVVSRGKLRAAPPDAIVRFLRQRPAAPTVETDEADDDAALDRRTRSELGLAEPEPKAAPRRHARAGAR